MTPAAYVERVPTYSAVQWDGSPEAAAWIVGNYPGATQDGEEIVVRDSMDRVSPLDRDAWVILDPATGMVGIENPAVFASRYQPAGA